VRRESPGEPAWVSTALSSVIAGPLQRGTVLTSTRLASYAVLSDTTDPSVIAIVAPGAVRLPVSLYVARLPSLGESAPVTIGGGVVTAAGHTWRPARWWDPRPRVDAEALRSPGIELAGIIASEPSSAFGIDLEVAAHAVDRLANGDPIPACRILGLGPGLTPAGDDVVAGALAALALADRLPDDAAEAVLLAARSRTTSLSASLLSAASRGQVVPQASRLLHAIAAGKGPDTITEMARGLFLVGATSGHDLALGLAAALTATSRVSALEAI
jgi:uncharacterized protein DUF2877